MGRRGLLLHFALFCLSHVAKCKVPNGGYEHLQSRFVQSKINVLTWLTNVCREYFLKPTYDPVDLSKGLHKTMHTIYSQWLQTDNWQIDNEKAVIEYKGKDSCRESNHPFPFGWLDNRMSTRTSLIKRDFFCKKTIAQVEVQMNDAQSCGLIFRIVGERNYWGLLIDNKVLKLVRVREGELLVLKEFKELKIKNDEWYVLFAQEVIKDIKVKAGKYGDLSVDYLRKSEDESEYSTAKQVLRGKKWSTEYEKLKKGTPSLLYNLEEIESLYENFKDWCPQASLCERSKYENVYHMEQRVVSLFIDFFDSYSYNIVHYLRKVNGAEPIVVHPGEITIEDFVSKYYHQVDNVVISPGYGNPQTGESSKNDLIAGLLERKIDIPILGICFGHQLICHLYGCKIKKVKNMFHGDTNIINICKYQNVASDLFENVKDGFKATCYNSLKVSKKVSDPLRITCYSLCGNEFIVMGTQHKDLPYYTVQYHPESIESDFSEIFFENFKKITLKRGGRRRGIQATVNYAEHQLWSKPLQGEATLEHAANGPTQKAWKIKLVKLSGVHNLRNFSHAIFKAICYDPKDVSFWLDSNGEVLDAPRGGCYSKGGIQHDGGSNTESSRTDTNHLNNNCRFTYMGNAKGRLSELLEYYYAEEGEEHQMKGTILQLGKETIGESYRVRHYSEDPNNCLVHHMRDRINLFKDNYNIQLEEIKMDKWDGTFSGGRTNGGENVANCSTWEEEEEGGGRPPPDGYPYEGYLPKGAIEEDQFVKHKDSCLWGYFGFFTYEYNYETMKFLYKKKWKNHAEGRDSKNSIPISLFIFPQNFISLDLVSNNIYLISVEPEEAYLKSPLGHSPPLWSGQDVQDILQYNARWNDRSIQKIVRIVQTKRENYQHDKVPSVCIPPECSPPHEQLPNTDKANENKIVFSPLVGKDEYMENVKRCKEYIEKGHSYELCLTTQFRGYYSVSDGNAPSVDFLNMYLHIRDVNKVSYSCYIHYWRELHPESVPPEVSTNPVIDAQLEFTVMCFSPEEFLRKDKEDILFSKPIKGTIRRGKTDEEDAKMKEQLLNSKKDRAENLMIVDLTTNDFHRICQTDTVRVSQLFHIESYAYLHQMVSEIRGKLPSGKSFADAIVNVFPGGSMTGAPKPISISLLQSIEKAPRGVYSGSIGFISVQGNFILNIVIRTAVAQNNVISIGAGGAVTIKSDETEEYNEMLLKFMSVARPICYYLKEQHNVHVEYKL